MNKNRVETIVLLGHTGAGKSETGNTLTGGQNLFKASEGSESETQATSLATGKWFGREDEVDVTIIDTPGMGDSKGGDSAHISEMVASLKGEIKVVTTFVIVMNGQQPRLDNALKGMLLLFNAMFGNQMWKNTIVVCTRWRCDELSIKMRKMKKGTEEDKKSAINQFFVENFELDFEVPVLFLDNSYEWETSNTATAAELQNHRNTLGQFRQFVGNCENFECDHIEKKLTDHEQLKEDMEALAQEKERIVSQFENDKELSEKEKKKLRDNLENLDLMLEYEKQ